MRVCLELIIVVNQPRIVLIPGYYYSFLLIYFIRVAATWRVEKAARK